MKRILLLLTIASMSFGQWAYDWTTTPMTAKILADIWMESIKVNETMGIGIVPDGDMGISLAHTATVTATENGIGIYVNPAFTEAASGVHTTMAGIYVSGFTVNNDVGSTTTNIASIYVAGAPTGAAAVNGNKALQIASGETSLGGELHVSDSLVVEGSSKLDGDVVMESELHVADSLIVAGASTFAGAITLSGDLAVTGSISTTDDLSVGDSLTVTESITVGGNIEIDSAQYIQWNSADEMLHSNHTMTLDGFTTWDFGAVATVDFNGAVSFTSAAGEYTLDGDLTLDKAAGNATLRIDAITGSNAILALRNNKAGGNNNQYFVAYDGTAGGFAIITSDSDGSGTDADVWTVADGTLNSVFGGAILASADDVGAIGASGTAFSDLFLADAGVINFNSGDYTVTHSAGLLTLSDSLAVTESVSIGGYVTQGSELHAYGGFQDSAITIAVTQNAWAQITNASGSLWTSTEADGLTISGDTLTLAHTGDYSGCLSITLSGGVGDDFLMRIYNVTQTSVAGFNIGITTTGNANFANIALPLYLEATADDEYVIQVTNTGNNDDPIIRSSVFNLIYVHE